MGGTRSLPMGGPRVRDCGRRADACSCRASPARPRLGDSRGMRVGQGTGDKGVLSPQDLNRHTHLPVSFVPRRAGW